VTTGLRSTTRPSASAERAGPERAGPQLSGSRTAESQVRLLHRLLSARTITAVAQAAVDTMREAVASDVSWCGLLDDDVLKMAAYSGLRTAEMPALWRLKIGHGIGGRVAAERRTIVTRDYRRDPRRPPVMKKLIDNEGIQSGICAPIASGTEVLGVLYASHRAPRDWTGEEMQLVSSAARDTAVALILLREQAGERERAEEAERRAATAAGDLRVVRDTAVSLAHTEDIGAGLAVLARHLEMDVALLDPAGEVLGTSEPGARYRGSGAGEASAPAPARLAVTVGDQPLGVMRISGDRELTRAEAELAELCSHLIALQLLRERAALRTELRLHSEFLDDLLEGRLGDRPGMLARAALLGVDLRTPRHVACIGRNAGPDAGAPAAITRRTLSRVDTDVRRQRPGSIVVPRGGDVVVLLAAEGAGPGEVRRVLSGVVSATAGGNDLLCAGLGRLCIGLDDYADSYAEACIGLDLARRQSRAGTVRSWSDLGLLGLLARGTTRQSMESMVEHALGPILDADAAKGTEYVRTLDAYLASDRHLEHTAAVLHVHPNTVRYRISKVEEMLQVNLHDVDARFLLELALRVQGSLRRP
jgi:sugar diacid utilization regulator/putative methionine-R-sulfoxide reductase with GAF domain